MSALHGFSAAHLPTPYPSVSANPATEGDVPPTVIPASPESTQKVGAAVVGQESRNSGKQTADQTNDNKSNSAKDNDASASDKLQLLSDSERKQVEQLSRRDREVKAHEAAHLAAAGQHATSGAKFTYTRGPDGRSYAVGGSVGIDLSAEADPEATVRKADQIKRAALAPAEPSSQDRSVAAAATALRVKAQSDLVKLKAEEQQLADEAEKSENDKAADSQPATHSDIGLNSQDSAVGAATGSSDVKGDEKSETDSSGKADQSPQSCAVCGGSHGSEGHVNANRKKLEGSYGEVFPGNGSDNPLSPLSLLA